MDELVLISEKEKSLELTLREEKLNAANNRQRRAVNDVVEQLNTVKASYGEKQKQEKRTMAEMRRLNKCIHDNNTCVETAQNDVAQLRADIVTKTAQVDDTSKTVNETNDEISAKRLKLTVLDEELKRQNVNWRAVQHKRVEDRKLPVPAKPVLGRR